ncbi:RNA methyltransferase [Salinicola rhizosphaerae]|uniref:tRNA (cytidine/uridine-2'-O-)-methyltransferase TrmJ n=1 Tax=Salinicola rhizosphaerae TaxID=1443141 RepID=A0ABQ3E0U1_9GAMM|nr:RNA methyltransferase [Salinicola rhizosphaerae]GHB22673.1 tRNA (cytidine/uridine-2'-O-)-methyltransferase TrmJ [Salinicola rhizosphaerae]
MLDRLRIVLIGTSHPGNIGGAARAMRNMGLDDLALVTPRCDPQDREAYSRASGANAIVESASVFESLESAVEACTLVVGASARSRTLPWPMITPRALAESLPESLAQPSSRVALVFGREDTGLTNAELQRCHRHVHIPTNPEFSSLNLAAAVQVIAYECRQAFLAHEEITAQATDPETAQPFGVAWDNPPATHADMERFFDHLEKTLIALEFHDPDNPRQLMARLRRLFMRAHLDSMEMNILRGILGTIDKRLR